MQDSSSQTQTAHSSLQSFEDSSSEYPTLSFWSDYSINNQLHPQTTFFAEHNSLNSQTTQKDAENFNISYNQVLKHDKRQFLC